ncbi:hypothetical protein G9A89_007677 [Geosiphon pyriformis]|nr:hypothetical protein G9A89_007677 [Geosiphon pyriformis]
MNTSFKLLVATSKAPLLHGSHRKLMLMLIKKSLDGCQQMPEKTTPLSQPIFALAPVVAPAPQIAAVSFAAQTQDPNEQLIDKLTANLAQLLEPLAQASESTSQPEENSFFAFNLIDDDYDMDKLAINTSESTRKKKKAKVDFVLDPNKASTSTADNNKPPKAKVFKNPSKLESPEIVQKSGPYSVVKDLIETPAHIIFGQLMIHSQFRKDLHKSLISKKKTPKTNKHSCQAGLADNSNITPLICKAQMADYFIDLILDNGLSVSVIAKHFLEAIGRKIDESSTRPMTNVHGDKKKDLGIAKAIPVHINDISIETDMKVSEAKEYTIIVGNKWLKKAKALLDYELSTKQNQEDKPSEELDDEESDEKDKQEKQEETTELTYTTFTSNGKPLDNIQLLVVKQRELSPEERKIDIKNLLARNSPVILKEDDTPGRTHVIQHTIITRETCFIYLKSYQSNCQNDEFIKKEINWIKELGFIQETKSD